MKRAILILITLLSVLSLNALPVRGQEGTITLKHQEIRNQFPDGIVFKAVAETTVPAKIQEIKLEVKIKGSTRLSYAFLDFEPATSVQGEYLLRTGGAQFKPPGTLLEYDFIITDSAGRTLETERETFLYLDNRFQWEKVTEGLVEVYYYGPTADRARLILKAGTDTVARMGALLGVVPEQPIRVIAYNDYSQMASALPFVSQATQTELVTQGIAFYEYGVLLLLAGDPRADGTTSHEVTHMLVSEATKEAFVNLPAWLNEGMAEYANINPGQSYDVLLSEAISSNTLFPLRHLQTMPGVPREALLFYGQARSVVKYLINTYGQSKVPELFAAFKQGLQIDEALKKVYGFDQDGLDNAWRKSLGVPPLESPKEQAPVVKANRWTFGCAPVKAR